MLAGTPDAPNQPLLAFHGQVNPRTQSPRETGSALFQTKLRTHTSRSGGDFCLKRSTPLPSNGADAGPAAQRRCPSVGPLSWGVAQSRARRETAHTGVQSTRAATASRSNVDFLSGKQILRLNLRARQDLRERLTQKWGSRAQVSSPETKGACILTQSFLLPTQPAVRTTSQWCEPPTAGTHTRTALPT